MYLAPKYAQMFVLVHHLFFTKLTVFLELRSQEAIPFLAYIMSADKYPRVFLPQEGGSNKFFGLKICTLCVFWVKRSVMYFVISGSEKYWYSSESSPVVSHCLIDYFNKGCAGGSWLHQSPPVDSYSLQRPRDDWGQVRVFILT